MAPARHDQFEFELAAYLARLRDRAGLTQDELGRQLGHDQSFVSRVENVMRRVSVDDLLHWAQALELDVDEVAQEAVNLWRLANGGAVSTSLWDREQPERSSG